MLKISHEISYVVAILAISVQIFTKILCILVVFFSNYNRKNKRRPEIRFEKIYCNL